jgi:4-phospho-D-threonate 3-dehydrogenase / 4-phospho-D-erythronate 3-dehydrogenase
LKDHLVAERLGVVPKLGITPGDPAGIGPEVLVRSLASFNNDFPFIPVIIARRETIEREFSRTPLGPLEPLPHAIEKTQPGRIYLHELTFSHPLPQHGIGSLDSARESLACIDEALTLRKNGFIDAIVTAPVHKGLIEQSGTPFMGHTEYIAEKLGEPYPYMMMFSQKYRVILVTTHYQIRELASLITDDAIYRTIRAGHDALCKADHKAPRIAVAGIDPHCGDSGAIGMSDSLITKKAIEKARDEGIDVHGPFSADTLFMPSKWEQYDLAVAHYHDQGLIPFKMLAFESGVNVTLGLSVVRTSVDHGTAFDIAGKGLAQHTSMTEALLLAARLSGK